MKVRNAKLGTFVRSTVCVFYAKDLILLTESCSSQQPNLGLLKL